MSVSLLPQTIDRMTWYYEYPDHVEVVCQLLDPRTQKYLGTTIAHIPWSRLKKSLKRCQPKKGA